MRAAACALSILLSVGNPATAAPPERPYLALEMAETATRACRQLAEDRGWRVAVAVLDSGGDLLAFARMDSARVKPIEIAMLKAGTAATTGRSTLDLRRIALIESDPPHGIERAPGIIIIEGGEPIFTKSGALIGGIGVSGATPAQDGECARAGIAAISDAL